MRVVSTSKGNTGKAHLATDGDTVHGKTITGEVTGSVAPERRCRVCVANSTPSDWEPAAPVASNRPAVPAGTVLCGRTVAGFSAHSRRPAECRFCGRRREDHTDTVPADQAPVASNRPADVPAVDVNIPTGYGRLTADQITSVERLISRLPYGAAATWVRQLGTGEIVLVDLQTQAPDAADMSAALGEPVTLTRDDRSGGHAIYRLHRDPRWCRKCFWVGGHGSLCPIALARKRPRPVLRGHRVERTDEACPLCARDGQRNFGGEVPTLTHFPNDERRFCIGLHGWVSDAERAAVSAPQ